MKEITSIKQISSNKYSLLIEGKKHVVYDDVLLKYHILKKGKISDEVYRGIINSNNFHEGYNRALKFIAFKMRTEKEVREKLTKISVPKKDQDMIIKRLYEERYLDDEKYIRAYINDQINLSLSGPKKIILNLKKEGFEADAIYKYIDNVNEDVWKDQAKKILKKKLKSYQKYSKKMFLMKLKNDYQNLGYDECHYANLLNNLDFDDELALEKDYQKVLLKLSKKYQGDKLQLMIKQKLYALGYSLDNIEKVMK